MADISFNILDNTNVQLECEDWLLRELDDRFTFYVDGYQFMPKYKSGFWDGKIRLIDTRFGTTLVGLIPDIISYCKNQNYEVEFDDKILFNSPKIDDDVLNKYIKSCKLPYEVRDFQYEGLKHALKGKRTTLLSATGSGKSLIIYLIANFLKEMGIKTLIIVPTVSLVNQLVSDFEEYAEDYHFDTDKDCHKIFSGQDKESDKPIIVSTWQSLQKLPKDYFEQYGAVIGDEVHQYDAVVCNRIIRCCTNASIRIGTTGTLNESKVHELSIKALFGPIRSISNTRELMDKGILADLEVKALILKHDPAFFKQLSVMKYQDEINYIVQNKVRNDFISKLAGKCTGNTLVLFNYVEKHGKPLHEMMKKECKNKEVHLVYGGTDADMREQVRKLVEKKNNIIIVASYGVFSTGVNAVNLNNVIFASPTKSKIRVLQSIGRGLRKGEEKESCKLYDIADDLTGGKKTKNHTLKHFHKRFELYQQEGFDVSIHTLELK
jgi:superfamily II DNA or RNA helicase